MTLVRYLGVPCPFLRLSKCLCSDFPQLQTWIRGLHRLLYRDQKEARQSFQDTQSGSLLKEGHEVELPITGSLLDRTAHIARTSTEEHSDPAYEDQNIDSQDVKVCLSRNRRHRRRPFQKLRKHDRRWQPTYEQQKRGLQTAPPRGLRPENDHQWQPGY